LQARSPQAEVAQLCIDILEGALSCKGTEEAMAAYIRGILPVTKVLKMIAYSEHEGHAAKKKLGSILEKLKGPRDLVVSVRNWMVPEDHVGGVVVFDLTHTLYFIPDDGVMLGADRAFLDFALCVLPSAQAEAQAAALDDFSAELRLTSHAVVIQARTREAEASTEPPTTSPAPGDTGETAPQGGRSDMIVFSVQAHEDVLESVAHRLDKLNSLAEAKARLSVTSSADRRKSSLLAGLHRDVGSGNYLPWSVHSPRTPSICPARFPSVIYRDSGVQVTSASCQRTTMVGSRADLPAQSRCVVSAWQRIGQVSIRRSCDPLSE
jgi:hypothetical protein